MLISRTPWVVACLCAVAVAVASPGRPAFAQRGATVPVTAGPADTGWLLDRYEHGESQTPQIALAAMNGHDDRWKDLEKGALAWTESRGPNPALHRRLVAAGFIFEAAYARIRGTHFPGVDDAIDFGCQLILKNHEPSEAERPLLHVAAALAEGSRTDGTLRSGGAYVPAPLRTLQQLRAAINRGQNEPRLQLAIALLSAAGGDTETARDWKWLDNATLSGLRDPASVGEAERRRLVQAAMRLFEPLLAVPEVRTEAQVRMGHLWLTLHEPARALLLFHQAADDHTDLFLQYLACFLGGRASEMLTRTTDAERQYRAALAVIPHAQSATEALAASLFASGKPDEAYALVETSFAAHPRPDDPWPHFGYGDFRFMPALIVLMREALA
jgi:tetratricopeptide (TPR) repeat protein